jgi:hypothetical protein
MTCSHCGSHVACLQPRPKLVDHPQEAEWREVTPWELKSFGFCVAGLSYLQSRDHSECIDGDTMS